MRYYQNMQFQMLRNVSALLKKNKDDLSVTVPALEDIIDDFVDWIDQLFKLKAGMGITTPVTAGRKRLIRKELEDAALKLTGVLRAHHYKNRNKRVAAGDAGVENESASEPALPVYTVSDLKKAPANKLYHICNEVISEVIKIKSIRDYGLTAEDIKKAEHCLQEFAKIKHAPSQSKKDTATRNEELAIGVKEAVANLENTIDPLMRIAAEDDKELYARYKGFRKVMAKGKGRISQKEAAYRRSRKRKKG